MATISAYSPTPPEDVQIAAISLNPSAIRSVKNPSENVQKIAVSRDSSTLEFISNPSEEVQEVAVLKHPMSVRFIANPSDRIQMLAFKDAHGAFYETKNPCKELCLAAANQFGAQIFSNRNINWKAPWVGELVKAVMARSPHDAYDCVSNFTLLPRDLAIYAFEQNYKCYSKIAKMKGYDGYLDAAYARKKREIERENKLPLFGHGDAGDFNQDQLRLMRWFKLNDATKISVRELRKQVWGNTPYFNNLVQSLGGRDITKADLKNASTQPISKPTLDLMSKATVGVTEWKGVQRLFVERPNKVAVFHVPFSAIKNMTDDEGALKKIAADARRGGHPVAPKKKDHNHYGLDFDPDMFLNFDNPYDDLAHITDETPVTLGWVRYTVFDKDIWIDEVQTDMSKLLPQEIFAGVKDLQDAIMLEFLKRMRRRGSEKFFMPTFELKTTKYAGFGKHLPPENIYRDLPRKMRFHQGIIQGVDPLVDGEKAWILEGYSQRSL